LGDKWQGWHSFRCGLATNLYTLGVPPKVIQSILRYVRVETTQKHYVVIDAANAGAAAMQQLEKAVRRSKLGQQVANSKTGSKNRASRETAWIKAEKLEPTSGLEPLICRLRIIVRSYRCRS
jgi:hypothetical protein